MEYINDHNRDLSERMFALVSVFSVIVLSVIWVWDVFIGESWLKLTILGGAIISMIVIVALSIRFRFVQTGAFLISLAIIFIVLPLEFFTGGGVYGCTPIWYAFSFMYVGLNVKGKKKFFLIGMLPISAIACYLIAYYNTRLLTNHIMKTAYLDSIASLIGVGFLLYLSVTYIVGLFNSENALANRQKEEIENLNMSQNRFFSSMSHEIRTPINTIIGLNEMTLRENISDEVAENSMNIQSASKMLLALINDILDMSKIESGKMDIVPVPYNVGDMMSDIVNMIWIRAKEKGLEFHIDIDTNIPTRLYGDEVRIKQVLINVLNNAVKYTKEGSVTLSIQCKKVEGGRVALLYSVTDTGMGIKKESIPYLFTAFKRVDEEENRHIEGTGLGLSIVKQLVELMGGEISVNSIYTKGSTFMIELIQDIVDENAIGELNLETRHSINAYEHYKQSFEAPEANVLVVDDNDTNIMVAEKLLRDTKVKVDTALSGEEALKKTLDKHYDIILMDHLMPMMDGIECLHTIRSQSGGMNRETPIIVMTANAGSDNQAMYRREGFDGYILKPVSGSLLESEIVKHLPKELVKVLNNDAELGEIMQPMGSTHKTKIPVLISTDSVCDLPKNMLEQRGIPVLPYHVITEEGVFLDGVEAETEGILSYMIDGGSAASEAPTVEEYEQFFAENLEKAHHIIHITMAKNVSKGFANAKEAATAFDNVTVIDSGNLTLGMGFLVLYAYSLTKEDATVESLVNKIKAARPRIHTDFVVDSTEFLARSGRINHRVDTVCRMLMLHPVITLKKNSMKVKRIYIGTRLRTWKNFINDSLETLIPIDDNLLFVPTAGQSLEELDQIKEWVTKKKQFREIKFKPASSVITVNCGPGSFGLVFMTKA
ncbi:MAG: DegV family EDD domain-containing protein [Lachnospiraceae bacterium]|nr:DegV family EDD domain-containing protein [Lachnospiraceae bacterium]